MLSWYKHLYVGNNVKKNIKKYKMYINKGKLVHDVYLITLASNQVDQLDIISCYYLLQNAIYHRCPLIIGVAKGKEEAHSLVLRIVEETFAQTGTADVKKYIMQR